MIRKKLHNRLKKTAKDVKARVPDAALEKAANLNPLSDPIEPEPMSLEDVPRITNETITEHREEVLKGARKFIYPLQQSKHRIVGITASIAAATIAAFLIYCTVGLYRFYQYNTFLYRVTQVAPFPIARTGGTYIAYENYLFELRHYVHYYQNQLQRNFNGADRQQLLDFRKQALQNVINAAYIKILANQNHVSVSDKEVNNRLNEVREQNRLGSNNKVFADVLHDYWGWSVSDFKRSLKQAILAEKVTAKLDTADTKRAADIAVQAKTAPDFGALAKEVSDDPAAKTTGGDYGFAIAKNNPNVPPQVVNALFSMKAGQVSGVILASPLSLGVPPTLEIVKVIAINGDSVTASHIVINLKDINTYIKPLAAKQPAKHYVKF